MRLVALLRQGPPGHVQHVVQRAHLHGHGLLKGIKVKAGFAAHAKGVAHKAGEDDGPQIAAAVVGQGLLAAGVGGGNGFAIVQVVVAVDLVKEQNARLGKVVGRLHDGVPQLARLHLAVYPQAVCALVAAGIQHLLAGLGLVHQLPRGIIHHGLHEGVAHAYGYVEVVPAPGGALGGDEFQHVRVVDAQHAHLRATAGARAFYGRAALVKHIDVAARAAGDGVRAFYLRALGADARKVVTHPAAAAHGFCCFAQRFVNAGVAFFIYALNGIAHGLHKAVDERGLNIGARRTHDAACANGAGAQIVQELLLPLGAQFGLFRPGQRPRYALVQLLGTRFAGLEVFFGQYIVADGLNMAGGSDRGRG